MKKILLLSDTHSHIDDVILKYVNQADEVWHAGDIGDLAVTDAIKKLNHFGGFMETSMMIKREWNFH